MFCFFNAVNEELKSGKRKVAQTLTLSTSLILAVCRTRIIHELRNGPRSPKSLCGSVVEHWSPEIRGRFVRRSIVSA